MADKRLQSVGGDSERNKPLETKLTTSCQNFQNKMTVTGSRPTCMGLSDSPYSALMTEAYQRPAFQALANITK